MADTADPPPPARRPDRPVSARGQSGSDVRRHRGTPDPGTANEPAATPWWRGGAAIDTLVCLGYTAVALWITHGLWPDPATRAIGDNPNDQALIEWFLAHGMLVWTGDFSLVTERLNAPDGVNLMSNASHIVHGVLMSPVTAIFGVAVSFALLVALNLAATAAGWHLLLARTLGMNRVAAGVGGLFAGFAPGMISQSNSHLHMTAQWLVPAIVWAVVRLAHAETVRTTLTSAMLLAGLVSVQLLLGEEVLFLTALTLMIFAITYAARRPQWVGAIAPRFLGGMLLAAVTSGAIVSYPLWVQFAGDQHTPNAPFGPEFFYADVASYAAISPLSIAGSPDAGRLATSSAEYTAYLGVPLLLLIAVCLVWRWRAPATAAIAVSALVMTWLSFGPHVTIGQRETDLPSIYSRLHHVPVINGALPTRYALALIPLIAVLLAMAIDAAWRADRLVRIAVVVAVVAALTPIAPKPLHTTDRPTVPPFITSGGWRDCVPAGGVLVPVPLPTPQQPDLMRWPATAAAAFAIPEGFFIGPYGPQGQSSIGTYPRPTSALLADVAKTGVVPEITGTTRAQALADLQFWRADCVALAHVPNEDALRATLDQLLGPGRLNRDTWTWPLPN